MLAQHGLYSTAPNPRVGCVIVSNNEIVGRGWHERAGQDHAEVRALSQAKEKSVDSTVYVTLEPCNHHGRTPPCVDALLAAKVKRVVVAVLDPDPRTAGQGVERLRAAGIMVDVGVLANEACELNIGFMNRQCHGRPFYRLKLATSLDGRATAPDGQSQWITSEQSRADAHSWRARACAVVTGIGTVLADNPQMTARIDDPKLPVQQPLRVILDSHGRLPSHAKILDGQGGVCVLSGVAAPDWTSQLDTADFEWVRLPVQSSGRLSLEAVLDYLNHQPFNEVHIEAGPTLSGAWLEEGEVDELLLYQSMAFLGAGQPATELKHLKHLSDRIQFDRISCDGIGPDLRLRLRKSDNEEIK